MTMPGWPVAYASLPASSAISAESCPQHVWMMSSEPAMLFGTNSLCCATIMQRGVLQAKKTKQRNTINYHLQRLGRALKR